MESGDHPSPGEPKPAAGVDDHRATTQARSYECTFCKRGFSNAQALGGHMNIHRKDRARLSKPSPSTTSACHTQFPFDISAQRLPPPLTYGQPLQPLALFAERAPRRGEEHSGRLPKVAIDIEGDEMGVDLELRLGPDRPGAAASTSSTMGLREFI